jgi:hypothetical protein
MGYVSRAMDKLPAWDQLVLGVLGIGAGIYGIAHYGWTFLLKMIFSPEL